MDTSHANHVAVAACFLALGIPFDGISVIEPLGGGGSGTVTWRVGRTGGSPLSDLI